MRYFKYHHTFKYETADAFTRSTAIEGFDIHTGYIHLYPSGLLSIRNGYKLDGPSGPTFDTPNSMDAALVHDALYQLMRMDLLPVANRKRADRLLKKMCIENGMSKARANLWYIGVRFRGASAKPGSQSRQHEVIIT